MTDDPFVIDAVAWHLAVPGNVESREHVLARFYSLAKFLQANGLAKRQLAADPSDVDDGFEISTTDLTKTGIAVMRHSYGKWLGQLDRGLTPDDVSLLEKSLAQVRRRM